MDVIGVFSIIGMIIGGIGSLLLVAGIITKVYQYYK